METPLNLSSQAYSIISQRIVKAELKPGTRISEKTLAENLNIGRTPVREALIKLRQNNLVEVIPQSGTFISKINLNEVKDARFVRRSIELQIMQEAVKHDLSKKDIIISEINLQNQEKASIINDFDLFLDLDNEFHHTFYQLTHHDQVWNWINQFNVSFNRYRFLSLKVKELSWKRLIQDHKEILEAVKNKDINKVIKLTKSHLDLVPKEQQLVIDTFPDYFVKEKIIE